LVLISPFAGWVIVAMVGPGESISLAQRACRRRFSGRLGVSRAKAWHT
jgi:hypothetical protein